MRRLSLIISVFFGFFLAAAALFLVLKPGHEASPATGSASRDETDVLVYGGTPAGIAAAVQAHRMGKSVVLIEPTQHLGGMMSSGLGFTDFIPAFYDVIGGISSEFFKRVGRIYGKPVSMTFEPHVAEKVFGDMVRESRARVIFGLTVDQVEMAGQGIVALRTSDGVRHRARMFIDASYEGDLMAKANVSYFVGREGNAAYGETLNGVQPLQGGNAPSAYVTPGRPETGLLPFVQKPGDLAIGTPSHRSQAYNYRLCVTTEPANRIPFSAPAGYNEADYALLAREIAARVSRGEKLELKSFLKIDALPNQKFDLNNSTRVTNGLLSTDLVGYNDRYPDASPDERRRFAAELQRYMAGLLYFLGHSPAVPEPIRREWLEYGLCADEFRDNGHWPYQVYVREARRMVSDYVMTEQDATGRRQAGRPVGLAAYYIDSHWVQRVEQGGEVRLEGGFLERIPRPFPVDYAAIVPKRSECRNLLVPVCLSASHVSYSAIRMEPTAMILGQSAGTAAALAIDAGIPVQDVDYPKLSAQLTRDCQVLRWPLPPEPFHRVILGKVHRALERLLSIL